MNGRTPEIIQAEESLKQAGYKVNDTTVAAPCDGIIGSMNVAVGTYVNVGGPVVTLVNTQSWRLKAAIPENWLELVKPKDRVIYSLRNYPGRVREAVVESVGRGVVQGQGIPTGNLPDTDARRFRQTDTPDDQSDFFVVIRVLDDRPDQPLRVGATGRVTIFASGGFSVVNTLATILHWVRSLSDYFFPKPSAIILVAGIACIAGGIYYYRR